MNLGITNLLKEVLGMAPANTVPIKQPTSAPVPKAAAAGVGGVGTTLLIFAAKRFLKIDIPPDVAAGIVTAVAFGFAYIVKDRKKAGA